MNDNPLMEMMSKMMGGQDQQGQPEGPPPKSQFTPEEAAKWVGLPVDYLHGLVKTGTLANKISNEGQFFDIKDLEPLRQAIEKLKSNRFKDVQDAIKKSKEQSNA